MTPLLRFGPFELRPQARQLLSSGQRVPLGARAFDVLLALVERRDRVVSKAELLDLAWPGLVVEENNLSVQISALRKALGAGAITTVPALGYRFTWAETPSGTEAGAAAALGPDAHPALQSLQTGGPVSLLASWGETTGVLPGEAPAQARFMAQAKHLVLQHGGQWAASPPGRLRADFATARAAAACCHLLHPLAQRLLAAGHATSASPPTPQLRAVLVEPGPDEAGAALLQRARKGQTLASNGVTQQLVHKLDGDLRDLGTDDAADSPRSGRTFDLMPPAASMPDKRFTASPTKLKPTLAIVPFAAYARAADPLSLGDILADQVIGALSRSPAFHVISRLSTLPFRDRDASVADIARSLAADFVLSGRYWLASGRLHLRVELADAAGSQVLWTQGLDDLASAVLQADSSLVQGVVNGVVQAVYAHEIAQVRGAALPDLASHTLLLAAINLLYRLAPRDFELARSALETLRQRAPRHATPLAWLARWHLFRVVQGASASRDEDGRLAQDLAERALDLDPDSSLALTMLGNVHTNFHRDLGRAEALYDRALALNPNESLAWLQKGNALSFAGDGEGALTHVQRAIALSPLDPARHFYFSIQASAALSAQRFDAAIDAANQSLQLNHAHVSTHRVLAIAHAMQGRLDEARRSVQQVLRLEPGLTVAGFVARSPGAQSGLAARFGQALLAAGLPPGQSALD